MFDLTVLGISTWDVVKGMFVIGMVVYILFALIVVRQVAHMTKTIKVGFEAPLRLGALIHFLASVALLLFAIVYL